MTPRAELEWHLRRQREEQEFAYNALSARVRSVHFALAKVHARRAAAARVLVETLEGRPAGRRLVRETAISI